MFEFAVLLGFVTLFALVVEPDVGAGLLPNRDSDEVGSPVDDIVPPDEPKEDEETDDEEKKDKDESEEDDTESPPASPEPAARFDEGLLNEAAAKGIPRAAALVFPTRESLQAALYRMRQVEQVPPPKTQAEFEKLKLDLGPLEDLDPEIKTLFVGVVDGFNEKLEKMHAGMAQVQSAEQDRQAAVQSQNQATFITEFDGFIKNLGDEWEEAFGKGPTNKLGAESDEAKNRGRVIQAMYREVRGCQANSEPLPDFTELALGSVRRVFGAKAEGHVRKNLSKQLKNTNGRLTARPTQRLPVSRSTDPEQQANDAVAAQLKEWAGG